ncbi:MAG: glutamyl-tRNA reductase [Chloroflexia bacterium]
MSVIGVSHDTAPVEVREQLSLPDESLTAALHAARRSAAECVLISTCNRLELYRVSTVPENPVEALCDAVDLDGSLDLGPYVYQYEGLKAARHLFRVAAGVDSQVLGEVQILGQVQRAWRAAHEEGVAGPVISQLFHRAVTLGKRVHTETSISRRPASVSYAAVMLAREIFGPELGARRVVVIGTGEVGEGVARCLSEHGLRATVVAHRHMERAHAVAGRYGAEIATWDQLPDCLAEADIVISSTAAPHVILQYEHISEATARRGGRPLYLMDLAVPRDIDPAAAKLPGVRLHNIDDLRSVVRSTLAERRDALPRIDEMIDEETARFSGWLESRAAVPAIRELRAQAEEITRRELEWAMPKLAGLTPGERRVVEALAARISGKLLHGPIQRLKSQAAGALEPQYGLEHLDPAQLSTLFFGSVGPLSGDEEKPTDEE